MGRRRTRAAERRSGVVSGWAPIAERCKREALRRADGYYVPLTDVRVRETKENVGGAQVGMLAPPGGASPEERSERLRRGLEIPDGNDHVVEVGQHSKRLAEPCAEGQHSPPENEFRSSELLFRADPQDGWRHVASN